MGTFESESQEEALQLLNNFNKVDIGTGTKYPVGIIAFLSTLIQG